MKIKIIILVVAAILIFGSQPASADGPWTQSGSYGCYAGYYSCFSGNLWWCGSGGGEWWYYPCSYGCTGSNQYCNCASNYGAACNRNACGGTGTIQCSGSCSASAPPVYGTAACGICSTGTTDNCNGACVGAISSFPYTLGAACNRNACGGTGTITNACTGACSATLPSTTAGWKCVNGNAVDYQYSDCGWFVGGGGVSCAGNPAADVKSKCISLCGYTYCASNYGNACTSPANVCGQTSTGTIGCSGSCSATTPANSNCPPPSTPSLSGSVASSSQIDLSWNSVGSGITYYLLRINDGTYPYAGTATSYSNTVLASGTSYSYKVYACNAFGCSGWSNTVTLRTSCIANWYCISGTNKDYQYSDCGWFLGGSGLNCGGRTDPCNSYCGGTNNKQWCVYPSSSVTCQNTCSGAGVCSSCTPSCGTPTCSNVEGQCGYTACAESPFTVSSITPYSQSGYPGSTKTYSFAIKNNDNSYCSAKTYTATLTLPAGFYSMWTASGSMASSFAISLNPNTEYTVEFVVSSSASASGTYYPSVRVSDGVTSENRGFALSAAAPTWSVLSSASQSCSPSGCLEPVLGSDGCFGVGNKNCGAYGCNPATGSCYPCPSGQTLCNGVCANTLTSSGNCGSCGNACTPPAATTSSNYCSAGGNVVNDVTTYSSSCSGGSCANTPSTTQSVQSVCQYGCNPATSSCYQLVAPTISISPKTVTAATNQEVSFSVAISNPNPFSHSIKAKTPKMYDNAMNERTDWNSYFVKYVDSNQMGMMEKTESFAPSSSKTYTLSVKVPPVAIGSKVRVKAIAEGSLVEDMAEITVADTTPPSVSMFGTPDTPCTIDPVSSWIDCSATAGINCQDAGSGCNPASYGFIKYYAQPASCPSSKLLYSATPPRIDNVSWVCGYAEDNAGNAAVSSPSSAKFMVNRTFTILVDARAYGEIDVPAGTEVKGYLCDPSQYYCNHDANYLASGSGTVGSDKKFRITFVKELVRGTTYKIGLQTEKGYAETEFVA